MNIPGNLEKFHLQVFIVPYLLKWIFLQRLPIQNDSKQSITEKIAHMWRRWGTSHNFYPPNSPKIKIYEKMKKKK